MAELSLPSTYFCCVVNEALKERDEKCYEFLVMYFVQIL